MKLHLQVHHEMLLLNTVGDVLYDWLQTLGWTFFQLFCGFGTTLKLVLNFILSSAIKSKLLQRTESQRLKWLGQHGKRGLM